MENMNLTKLEDKEIKAGRAKILKCAHCNKETYYGAMNLISLGIMNHKPVCSFKCNKELRQV